MQSSALPKKVDVVWASEAGAAYTRQVPDTVQQPTFPNAASFPTGFPPDTFVSPDAGGEGPDGRDMNGILQQLSAWAQWQAAGGSVPYDATFQGAIGGYPLGAIVESAVTPGLFWFSTAEANATNPDAAGAGWEAWPQANKLQTARMISATGDGSWSVSFDGSTNVTAAFTLATVNGAPGTYSNPQLTVDAKGRITAASTGGYFESAAQAVTLNSSGTTAHGLGGQPLSITAYLVCTTNNLGYTAGQWLPIGIAAGGSASGATFGGIQVAADATNVYWRIGPGVYLLQYGGSGNPQGITVADWSLVIVAKLYP